MARRPLCSDRVDTPSRGASCGAACRRCSRSERSRVWFGWRWLVGTCLSFAERQVSFGSRVWAKAKETRRLLTRSPYPFFRQIRDGSPMVVETKMLFRVSGSAREILLPEPNPRDTVALGVEGDLALSLERSGALRVQLVPGRHELTLLARRATADGQLLRAPVIEPWPSQEVWTWHPDTLLRVVELSGVPGVDPSRTDLPDSWKADAAFLVGPGEGSDPANDPARAGAGQPESRRRRARILARRDRPGVHRARSVDRQLESGFSPGSAVWGARPSPRVRAGTSHHTATSRRWEWGRSARRCALARSSLPSAAWS